MDGSEGEESTGSMSNNINKGNSKNKIKSASFTPSTPPPTAVHYRIAKRRKGIPRRAPMGGLIMQL